MTDIEQDTPAVIPAVIDVTLDNFMAEVIEASKTHYVLLDFWAEWCEPCKQLTPTLEMIVAQSSGVLKLAKMDIEAHPEIAQQMQVQSIPAVFLFRDGQPLDGFMGAQSESAIRAFLAQHIDEATLGGAADTGTATLAQAEAAIAAGNIAAAMEIYAAHLQSHPQDEAALAGLAGCYMQNDNLTQAKALIDMVPDSTHTDIVRLRADIKLTEIAQTGAADIEALEAAIKKNDNDHQARFDLALAHYGAGAGGEAIEVLLDLIERDRHWQEDKARKFLLEIFDAYSDQEELVFEGRRRLSSLLFS